VPICIVALLATTHSLKNDKGMRKEKGKVEVWNFLSDLCPPCAKSHRVDGLPRPLLEVVVRPPRHSAAPVGWPLWICENWSPLVVNEASRSSDGEEVETPNPSHTTSIVGSYRSLRFRPSRINIEVLNHLPCSLGLQLVSCECCPSSPLIL
jgi:hypothetical protein